MAAPMATHVRIKVYFENNEFDASWLLIDTSELKTMKDVQRYISLKFLGKTVPLYLTLQGCYLPDWEKSVILRDNDCVNAKCIHQDSFGNQALLVSNVLVEESSRKKKKKKDKVDSEEKMPTKSGFSFDKISSNEERKNSKDMEKERDGLLGEKDAEDGVLDIISTEKIQKKKKKKHKHEYEEEMEESDGSKEKRKRKHEKDTYLDTFAEPVLKKMSFDMSGSIEGKKKQKTDDIEPSQQEQASVSVDHRFDSMHNKDVSVENDDDKKQKRKRKRNRRRKKIIDSNAQKSLSETPKFNSTNMTNNAWNWSSGKFMDSDKKNSETLNSKHMVFHSDSNENDDNGENDTKNENNQNSGDNNLSGHEAKNRISVQSNSAYCIPNVKQSKSANQSFVNGDTNKDTSNFVRRLSSETETRNKPTVKVAEQPSILSTSYLTNGVAVYSRSRGKQQQNLKQYAELSKEEQLNTRLTNVSVIIQNESSSNNKKQEDEQNSLVYEAAPLDYSKFPALVGPPRAGDRLAYKVIELSETYTPEVSAYQEAVVCSYNHLTKIIELENLQDKSFSKKRFDGKFEIELSDEEEQNSLQSDTKVCLPIDSLIDPKLLS